MYVLGIDPGSSGAVAAFDAATGQIICVDFPTHTLQIGKSRRTRLDLHSLWSLLQSLAAGGVDVAVLEAVQGFGGKGQSASASFAFGHAAGAIEALCVAAGLPLHKVPPQTWKRALGVPADKDGARLAASRLFPAHAYQWQRVKDADRAEAALLALYGARKVLQ